MKMNLFHLPKHKQFDIPYRFHDPKEEERKKRYARIKEELGKEVDENERSHHSVSIKGSFSAGTKHSNYAAREKRKSNFRVILIIGLLVALAYWFLN